MKFTSLFAIALGSIVVCSLPSDAAESKKKAARAAIAPIRQSSSQKKLAARRQMLVERMKASREQLRETLPLYEQKLASQTADLEKKKELYQQDLISKLEVENSQQALANTELETERIRHWIAEDNRALSLAEEGAETELSKLPRLSPGTYDQTSTLIRYNGPTQWTPAVISKVARFYRSRFGRPLPVTAFGQTATHERMGFDHRDAVDVGVSPDSREGRGLMAYLRKARIPFLAFRGQVRGASTGAHIHIGPPSPRLIEAKHRPPLVTDSDESTEGG